MRCTCEPVSASLPLVERRRSDEAGEALSASVGVDEGSGWAFWLDASSSLSPELAMCCCSEAELGVRLLLPPASLDPTFVENVIFRGCEGCLDDLLFQNKSKE